MKLLFTPKSALLLASFALVSSALADVQYTSVTSMMRDGKLTPLSTSTTWLKAGLQRIDTKTEVGNYRATETTVTDVAKRQRLTLDPALKIYYVEPLGGNNGASSAGGAKAVSTGAAGANGKKSKLVMTLGAQFLGIEKLQNYDARHYKTSMKIDMSGDCGNSNTALQSEVWMADVKLPVLEIPGQNGNNYGYGGNSDGCAVTMETKGDPKAYEATQKGLALKTLMFDEKGKPISQSEITMLSFAAVQDSEFAVPGGFTKMTREEYNDARQKAMMSAFTSPAATKPAKPVAQAAPTETAVKTPNETAFTTPAARFTPVALKNDAKLDKSLLEAAAAGEVETAIAALQNGANPNFSDKGGNSALMLAAQTGKTELVQALLDMGANPNAANKRGQTALHLATTLGAPKPKKRGLGALGGMLGKAVGGNLLGGGLGDLGSGGAWASSLLGGGSLDGLLGSNLQGLLNGGAFNLSGKSGWSAIIGTALQGDLKSQGAYGLQKLLNGNSKLDAQGWIGLMSAVKGSNAQVLSAMSNIGGAQGAKWSQFIQAAASGDASSVTALLGDAKLKPVLDQALQGFNAASGALPANAAQNIVRSLLEKGASAATADGDGKTAAQLAQARNWNDLAALLR
ncbi:MAG TPA: ankyrin repeat domain-containing protein [Abditibacterium sp.]|jgi:hypothetical protein